ncbi:MAG: carboxymuconolactone decarboxylase family protein [Promethearchaeia archaeon]|nr:MAG: carboxymuconolactone decarboxylase family protein [Candidatus Lokiarchaeia archaeon]
MSENTSNSNLTKEILGKTNDHMKNLGQIDPEWMQSFGKFMRLSKKSGALSAKFKEIIGIAISVKAQCERCIVWHVKNAVDLGATRQEIIEACEVVVLMSGGPGLMYFEDVIRSLDDLGL